MISRTRFLLIVGLHAILFAAPSAWGATLDDYVAAPDANYSYVRVGSGVFDASTFTRGHVLRLTSQSWRDSDEVDHPTWTHWVTLIVPTFGKTKDTALLFIDGGSRDDPAPAIDAQLRQLSAATGAVIVQMTGVPNQPLLFSDETTARMEDEIIAYSWRRYFDTADASWPVQLPMVKSVVRCMDAVTSFVASSAGGDKTIRYFLLAGGSKRGWTAWLTAAVDQRVKAVVPIVSDLLNMPLTFAHHRAVYGAWADALSPYEDLGIFDQLDTPEGADLMQIVDPFSYRDRLTMPKYVILTTGDDFFVLDSGQFYLDGLPGETYVRHVPNTDHYLTGAYNEVLNGFVPYFDAIVNGHTRPRFNWSIEPDGTIRVECIDTPKTVRLWQASNPDARDFRLPAVGATAWQSSPLTSQGGVYTAQVAEPTVGWTAYFVELVFASPFSAKYSPDGTYDYRFTTRVNVVPSTLPYAETLPAEVYRFWSPVHSRHFYTTSAQERSKLIRDYPHIWVPEGTAYRAYPTDCIPGLTPVHRFWSGVFSGHFYTLSDAEKQNLIDNYSHVWTYEGVAFHAFPDGSQPEGTMPVYRFWSGTLNGHFYTLNEAERDHIIANYPHVWTYEGVAWYAMTP